MPNVVPVVPHAGELRGSVILANNSTKVHRFG